MIFLLKEIESGMEITVSDSDKIDYHHTLRFFFWLMTSFKHANCQPKIL